jgi:hypothetical protein
MRVSLCVSTMLLCGCVERIPHEDPTDVAKRGACTVLENVTFASIADQGDCGRSSSTRLDGPVACQWTISFAPNDASSSRFSWTASDSPGDVGASGIVTCDANGNVVSDEAEGYVDDSTLELIWDGVAYAPR